MDPTCVSHMGPIFQPIWDLLYTHVVWDTILFTLVQTEFFQYPDAFKKWDGDIYIYISVVVCLCLYAYCFRDTFLVVKLGE